MTFLENLTNCSGRKNEINGKGKSDAMNKDKNKNNGEAPDWAVYVAVVFGVAAGVLILYDSFFNMDDWHALFGIEYLARPAVLLALGCLIMALLIFFIGKLIAGWNPVSEAKGKVTENYKSMHEIRVCPELQKWETEINAMCRKVGIRGVKIEMVSDPAKNAAASAHILKGHDIYFGREYCDKLRDTFSSEMFHDIILLLLGHELAHLKTLDSYAVRGRKLLLLLIFVILAPCILMFFHCYILSFLHYF